MLPSLLLLTCLLSAEPAGHPPTGSGISKTDVDNQVVLLGANEKKARQAAEDRLIEFGPAVLDLLPSPDSQSDEEIKQALIRIRRKLQAAQAEASVAASTVTLHGRLKLSEALAAIQKQTGNHIAAPPQAAGVPPVDPEVNVDFTKTPFWTALDQVVDQVQLSVYPYDQDGLQLVPRGPRDLPRVGRATVVGPLRIEPVRVRAVRDLRSTAPAVLQVTLEVAWEPRLRPISLRQPMAAVKGLDPAAADLAADDPQAAPEALPRPDCSAVELDVPLAMPAPDVRELASLKGSLHMMILGRTETFSFVDLLKGKQQKRIASAAVALGEIRKNGDVWEINVQLGYDDAGDALESHRNWALQNKAYLKDAAGKPIEPDSMETTMRTPKELGVGYVFALDKDQSPEKMTFVYETPGLIATKDFAYELKGIKLP